MKKIILVFLLLFTLLTFTACQQEMEPIIENVPISFVLKYKEVDNGTIKGNKEQTVIQGEYGSMVEAVPNENFNFVKWSDGLENCERVDIANDNLEVYPIYEEKIFSITYKGVIGEHVFFNETLSATYSNQIEYSAPNFVGYKFLSWEDACDTETIQNSFEDKDKTFTAVYEKEYFELPVILVNTKDYAPILDKENYVECTVSIENTVQEYCLDNILAGIRGRGNTTWDSPKKPYRIKFDKKQSLFGTTYKQKSWTLLANHFDKSLSRNAIAYELSEQFNDIEFSSIHEFVEVYLNDEYLGVYLLCDQIQTGKGRVDIDESFDDSGNVGYLLELDARILYEGVENIDYFWFDGKSYAIKTPDTEDKDYDASVYVPYIKTYLEDCKTAFNGEWQNVLDLIDVNSFVDTYIILELFANNDCDYSSFYLYKDKDGKLFAGPVWDFDIGAGNCCYQKIYNEESGECLPNTSLCAIKNYWYKKLLNFDEFKVIIKEKLETYNDRIERVINLLDSENKDGYYEQYKQALIRNFEKWQIMGENVYPNTPKIISITTVDGQMEYVKKWLLDRLEFMKSIYCE